MVMEARDILSWGDGEASMVIESREILSWGDGGLAQG